MQIGREVCEAGVTKYNSKRKKFASSFSAHRRKRRRRRNEEMTQSLSNDITHESLLNVESRNNKHCMMRKSVMKPKHKA